MEKLKSLEDLRKMKENVKNKIDLREKCDNPDNVIQIRVAMATCGIASGAKEVMTFLMQELDRKNIDSVITQTGCMSYCYAEPTIEVTKPGQDPVVFGYVDIAKASEIIEKYILGNELVEGIIPVNYNTMNE